MQPLSGFQKKCIARTEGAPPCPSENERQGKLYCLLASEKRHKKKSMNGLGKRVRSLFTNQACRIEYLCAAVISFSTQEKGSITPQCVKPLQDTKLAMSHPKAPAIAPWTVGRRTNSSIQSYACESERETGTELGETFPDTQKCIRIWGNGTSGITLQSYLPFQS